jgi:hypothetical protein
MQAGAGGVEVRRDGTIFIRLTHQAASEVVINPNLGLEDDDGADL